MAQFRATIEDSTGMVSRLCHKRQGIVAKVNGWSDGVKVIAAHDERGDYFDIYVTGGSNGRRQEECLGTLRDGKFVPVEDDDE